jgi:hypothetical protein
MEEQRLEGKMFNHYNWGGYLIWRLWPDYRVFVDGRTDLYGDAFLRQYLETLTARSGFQERLREYDVDFVVIPSQSILATQLACEGEWRESYRDEVATIWVRRRIGD